MCGFPWSIVLLVFLWAISREAAERTLIFEQENMASVLAHITSLDSQDSHHFLSYPFPQELDIITSTYSSCSRTFISPMFCRSKHHSNTHFLDTAFFIFWRVLLIKLHGKVIIFTYAFYTFWFLWPNCFPKDSYQHNCY